MSCGGLYYNPEFALLSIATLTTSFPCAEPVVVLGSTVRGAAWRWLIMLLSPLARSPRLLVAQFNRRASPIERESPAVCLRLAAYCHRSFWGTPPFSTPSFPSVSPFPRLLSAALPLFLTPTSNVLGTASIELSPGAVTNIGSRLSHFLMSTLV